MIKPPKNRNHKMSVEALDAYAQKFNGRYHLMADAVIKNAQEYIALGVATDAIKRFVNEAIEANKK